MISSAGYLACNYSAVRSLFDFEWFQKNYAVPEENLTSPEKCGLERVKKIVEQIQNPHPLAIGAGKEGGFCKTYGSQSRAHLLFSKESLAQLGGKGTLYKEAWEKEIRKLPDDIEMLKKAVKRKDSNNAASLIGLYGENKFLLNDDELYFVLRHEILGHQQNYDNEKSTALQVVAMAVALIFLETCGPTEFFPAFFLLMSLFCATILKAKHEFTKEGRADRIAIAQDERAKRGAKSFFKKMFVNELAKERYYELTGKAENGVSWIVEKKLEEVQLGHPSAELRYIGSL